jgi:hypothetical protein
MSRKFRVEVGVQALDCMTGILKSDDRNDEEIVGYSLDTLANICSPDEFDEEIQVRTVVQKKMMITSKKIPQYNFNPTS